MRCVVYKDKNYFNFGILEVMVNKILNLEFFVVLKYYSTYSTYATSWASLQLFPVYS